MSEDQNEVLRFRWDYDPDISAAALEKMGSPHLHIPPAIHVAGTNGKGSVIAFMRAILEADRQSCHAFTKPHLISRNERFRLARNPGASSLCTDEELIAALDHARVCCGPIRFKTLAEVTTVAAFQMFATHPADWSLIETGCGGTHDATNVLQPAASVITPISFDHMDVLGHTHGEIASHKAGIIKPGRPVIVGRQHEEALGVIRERARTMDALVHAEGDFYRAEAGRDGMIYEDALGTMELPLPALAGAHQIDNAALAIAALRTLGAIQTQEAFGAGLLAARWPGRFQKLTGAFAEKAGPHAQVYADIAHNSAGGEALGRVLADLNAAQNRTGEACRVTLICGFFKHKDVNGFVDRIAPYADDLIAVPLPECDVSKSPDDLAALARTHGLNGVVADSLEDAILHAGQINPAGQIVVCGSIYHVRFALIADGTTNFD
ncbi:MAG: bifunctional folylpolyglutamate synthase/dihydrofolate synthase [Hyphomicrobiaceae bacterium]|nr:bifunctional folylpolyglutamate synthase/dihydrofolate synthase [Hyphomicrobiaceae bacterium]